MNLTNTLLLALGIIVVVLGALHLSGLKKSPTLTYLANVAGGAYEFGVITRTAETAFTARYLLGQKGATDGSVIVNAANSSPLYIVEDEPSSGDVTACAVLGNATGLRTVIASGVITEGESVITDAGGKVQAEATAAAGDYFRVGRAMSTTDTDGDEMVIAHHKPEAVTIA